MTEQSGPICENCLGAEWVCENHMDRPWGGLISTGTSCDCGAGAPCPVCNAELASAGFVDRREKAIAAWLRWMEPNYSGWNPHDEQFDDGWNSAVEWVAKQIEAGEHWAFVTNLADPDQVRRAVAEEGR